MSDYQQKCENKIHNILMTKGQTRTGQDRPGKMITDQDRTDLNLADLILEVVFLSQITIIMIKPKHNDDQLMISETTATLS